jgi:hypothetical protein
MMTVLRIKHVSETNAQTLVLEFADIRLFVLSGIIWPNATAKLDSPEMRTKDVTESVSLLIKNIEIPACDANRIMRAIF